MILFDNLWQSPTKFWAFATFGTPWTLVEANLIALIAISKFGNGLRRSWVRVIFVQISAPESPICSQKSPRIPVRGARTTYKALDVNGYLVTWLIKSSLEKLFRATTNEAIIVFGSHMLFVQRFSILIIDLNSKFKKLFSPVSLTL